MVRWCVCGVCRESAFWLRRRCRRQCSLHQALLPRSLTLTSVPSPLIGGRSSAPASLTLSCSSGSVICRPARSKASQPRSGRQSANSCDSSTNSRARIKSGCRPLSMAAADSGARMADPGGCFALHNAAPCRRAGAGRRRRGCSFLFSTVSDLSVALFVLILLNKLRVNCFHLNFY